jgi:transcriptional regulator with XRE-family HTH domain
MQAGRAKTLRVFGRTVRRLRIQRHLSQEQLAEAARISRNYVSDIERGTRNPSLVAIIALARALAVPLASLVEDLRA